MQDDLYLQQKIVPELMETLYQRFQILHMIRMIQPVGRRVLATNMSMTERVLRAEVTTLKNQGLINIETSGMSVTAEGEKILHKLEWVFKDLSGISRLEKELKDKLNLEKVIVVPGNSDISSWVVKELGKACFECIKTIASAQNIVAITGGSTMAAIAEQMKPNPQMKELLFVPARGGFGEAAKYQANTICAKIAEQTLNAYRLLHVPDQLSAEAYEKIVQEPSVKEVLTLIHSANIVIHGIGEAKAMAERRQSPTAELKLLRDSKAVGEAFGYYFNAQGDVVHKVQTVGLQLHDLSKVPYVVSVAGGTSKAKAIDAFMKQNCTSILITDMGAAQELLKV